MDVLVTVLSKDTSCVSNTDGTGQWSEGDPFTNLQSSAYWSSTSFESIYHDFREAFTSVMSHGGISPHLKSYAGPRIWPVRDAQ